MQENLVETFFNKYTSREETMYRLPLAEKIDDFWPKELEYRKERGVELPLKSCDGKNYFYVQTDGFAAAADQLIGVAREGWNGGSQGGLQNGLKCDDARQAEFAANELRADNQDELIEEAYYSSAIEGADSTSLKAAKLIKSGKKPHGKDERMIVNNYRALQYVLANLEEPITKDLIVEICKILTEGTLDDEDGTYVAGGITGYRDDDVYVMSAHGDVAYTAPDASHVKPMMDQLIAFVNDRNVHPIVRAAVSHIYFVIIHPFFDGNGRTARALTYMILLQAGYDFFREVPISRILAGERSRYYKSIRKSQDPQNGYDFTYFVDYYVDLLARTVESVRSSKALADAIDNLGTSLNAATPAGARQLRGASWMLREDISVMTSNRWKDEFNVSFETARSDLKELAKMDFVKETKDGRKIYFERM